MASFSELMTKNTEWKYVYNAALVPENDGSDKDWNRDCNNKNIVTKIVPRPKQRVSFHSGQTSNCDEACESKLIIRIARYENFKYERSRVFTAICNYDGMGEAWKLRV